MLFSFVPNCTHNSACYCLLYIDIRDTQYVTFPLHSNANKTLDMGTYETQRVALPPTWKIHLKHCFPAVKFIDIK